VRTLLLELRSAVCTWDDIVLVDGLKAAQSLVDARTELDNDLALLPPGGLPCTSMVGPKINLMEKRLADLDLVLLKLNKQFEKMATIIDGLESVVYEAHKTKGWKWVHEEPLWCTWTLEKFATEAPVILPVYHRALHQMAELVSTLRSHQVSFEVSREVISKWATQPWLHSEGWTDWEDLCSVEVERWDTIR